MTPAVVDMGTDDAEVDVIGDVMELIGSDEVIQRIASYIQSETGVNGPAAKILTLQTFSGIGAGQAFQSVYAPTDSEAVEQVVSTLTSISSAVRVVDDVDGFDGGEDTRLCILRDVQAEQAGAVKQVIDDNRETAWAVFLHPDAADEVQSVPPEVGSLDAVCEAFGDVNTVVPIAGSAGDVESELTEGVIKTAIDDFTETGDVPIPEDVEGRIDEYVSHVQLAIGVFAETPEALIPRYQDVSVMSRAVSRANTSPEVEAQHIGVSTSVFRELFRDVYCLDGFGTSDCLENALGHALQEFETPAEKIVLAYTDVLCGIQPKVGRKQLRDLVDEGPYAYRGDEIVVAEDVSGGEVRDVVRDAVERLVDENEIVVRAEVVDAVVDAGYDEGVVEEGLNALAEDGVVVVSGEQVSLPG